MTHPTTIKFRGATYKLAADLSKRVQQVSKEQVVALRVVYSIKELSKLAESLASGADVAETLKSVAQHNANITQELQRLQSKAAAVQR